MVDGAFIEPFYLNSLGGAGIGLTLPLGSSSTMLHVNIKPPTGSSISLALC